MPKPPLTPRFSPACRETVQIHLLEFDEDRFDVTYKIYRHPGQVWDLAPCPAQGNLLFTVHRTGTAARRRPEAGS